MSPVFGPALPGTGFEILPPLSIVNKPFHYLKSICLKSVGLGFDCVPFHAGWELVEWKPLSASEVLETEFDKICEEIEEEERVAEERVGVVEPQIELNLGEGSSIHEDEPMFDVFEAESTVFIEEDDSSVEVLISEKEMKSDQAEGSGTEPVPEDACLRKDSEVVGTGAEPVPVEAEKETGVVADLGTEEGDLASKESFQTTPVPSPKHPAESPLGEEPRKKRIKMPAGRTDLPWVRDLKEKTSSSSQKSPPKQPSQPTRKSHRLVAQGIRSSSTKQESSVIEEIPSSSEESPVQTPSSKPDLKRKAEDQPSPATASPAEPSVKRVKSSVAPSPKLEKFQKRGVVRGKLVKVRYFQEQGLEVFLEKLKAQGWFELFTNTQVGCSQPDVAEFYANVSLSGGILSSTVNGVLIEVDARALGVILGIPATGFDLYVREDKSLLGKDRMLELAQKLSQQPGLLSPQSVKKVDMQPIHQLIFWFIIKNIIPRAQGRNQADAMDQCLTDLMDRGEQINLSGFMINHIMRIATTSRAHDLGYGFLLTRVFEHFGVELRKKVDAQVIDEIGSSTIMGCGYVLIKAGDRRQDQEEQSSDVPAPARRGDQGVQTPSVPDSRASPSQPVVPSTASDQGLRNDLSTLQRAFQEEKELNAKRHADLLALLTALQPKPPSF